MKENTCCFIGNRTINETEEHQINNKTAAIYMKSQPKNLFAKYRKGRFVKNNRVFSGSCFFLRGKFSSEIRVGQEGGEAGGRNIYAKRLALFCHKGNIVEAELNLGFLAGYIIGIKI